MRKRIYLDITALINGYVACISLSHLTWQIATVDILFLVGKPVVAEEVRASAEMISLGLVWLSEIKQNKAQPL